eukprot:TRINITY_DN649_c0_g1_i1.p1 TRINITY_DN649_c0_g1~~TRINITY_DN649_c0_g1_i1.p1  ORF type:complete len:1031 (-),score=234.21 TRINITY_DN649_c0_g1_i1:49-3141(-)
MHILGTRFNPPLPVLSSLLLLLLASFASLAPSPVKADWQTYPSVNVPPPNRFGHTMVSWSSMFYIFGGVEADTNSSSRAYINSVVAMIDLQSSYATYFSTYSNESVVAPTPRGYHTADIVLGFGVTCINETSRCPRYRYMIVHGGETADGTPCNDMWALPLDPSFSGDWVRVWSPDSSLPTVYTNMTGQPSNLTARAGPSARSRHALVSNGTHVFIFGGWDGSVSLGDLWVFSLATGQWDQRITRTAPPQRFGHAMTLIGSDQLMVYAGTDNFNAPNSALSLFNDMTFYSLSTNQWSFVHPQASQDAPASRYGHILMNANDDIIFMYGGTGVSGLLADTWIKLKDHSWKRWGKIKGRMPAPLTATAAAFSRSGFVVFGGIGKIASDPVAMMYSFYIDCQHSGSSQYGLCYCNEGYSGDTCEYVDDTPLLLGLGLAVSVPILCFGWCILRCVSLPTRMRILALSSLGLSGALGAGYVNCPQCWLPACLVGVVSGFVGAAGVYKCRQVRLLLSYATLTVLSFCVHVYAIAAFLGNAGVPGGVCGINSSGSSTGYWSCRYVMVVAFVDIALKVLAVPLTLRLVKHRRHIFSIRFQPNGGIPIELVTYFPAATPSDGATIPVLSPSKKDEKRLEKEKERAKNSGAINFLRKEEAFREKVSEIYPTDTGKELRIAVSRDQSLLSHSFEQLHATPPEQLRNNLYIRFQGEEGVDLGGVRKEWFVLILRQLFNPDYALFCYAPSNDYTFRINPDSGLNPDHLDYFRFAGRIVGRALLEGHYMEQHFSRYIYKLLLGHPISLDDMEAADPEYFRGLKWLLENDISGPGGPAEDLTFSFEYERAGVMNIVDLKENGRNIPVTEDTKAEFVALMNEWKLKRDCSEQFNKFSEGFYSVIPPDFVRNFSALELEILMCGLTSIDVADWMAHTQYRGFSAGSNVIVWFWEIVTAMDAPQRAGLLQFVTGTVKVPPGGFSALRTAQGPQVFVIQRMPDSNQAQPLPVAHTCFNRLDLPDYPDKERLAWALNVATTEGLLNFSLV